MHCVIILQVRTIECKIVDTGIDGFPPNAGSTPGSVPMGGSGFQDPAIMSSVPYAPESGDRGFNVQLNEENYPHLGYGRPPGLQFEQTQPPGLQPQTLGNGQPSGLSVTAPMQIPITTQAAGFNHSSMPQCKSSRIILSSRSCIMSHALQRGGCYLHEAARRPAKHMQRSGWGDCWAFFPIFIGHRE